MAVAVEIGETVFEMTHDGLVQPVGQPGQHQRVVHVRHLRNPDSFAVQKSARSPFPGIEALPQGHFMNDSDHRFAGLRIPKRDTHGIRRKTVHEIGGAVQRVDDPLIRGMVVRTPRSLFGDEAGFGQQFFQRGDNHLLSAFIDIGDEVMRPFHFDFVGREPFPFGGDIRCGFVGDLPNAAAHLFPIRSYHMVFRF